MTGFSVRGTSKLPENVKTRKILAVEMFTWINDEYPTRADDDKECNYWSLPPTNQ